MSQCVFTALLFVLSLFAAANSSAQTLSVFSGDGQVTVQNFLTEFPLVVQATNASGKPMAGVTVNFSLSGPGNLVPAMPVVTDINGQASVSFVGATIYGDNAFTQSTVTASAGSSTVTFHVTTSGEDLTSGLVFVQVQVNSPTLGQVLSGPSGGSGTQVVQVYVYGVHQAGVQLVPNVAIRLIPENPNGPSLACTPGTGVTDQTGIANCRVVFSGPPGNGVYDIQVGGYRTFNSFSFTVTQGSTRSQAEAINIISGANQSGPPGSQLLSPLIARIQNPSGTPLSNVGVVWQQSGSVTLTNVTSVSDANGVVSATAIFGTATGASQVTLRTADGAAQVTFTMRATTSGFPFTSVGGSTSGGAPAVFNITGGNNQSGTAGSRLPIPLSAQVIDGSGNPLPNVSVVWQPGPAVSLSNVVLTSDASGTVSAVATLGLTTGSAQVQVQTGGGGASIQTPFGPTGGGSIQAVFNLTVAPNAISTPTRGQVSMIRIINGNNQTGSPGSNLPVPLQAQIVDAAGNSIPNVSVSWSSGPSVSLSNVAAVSDANGFVSAVATLGATPGPAVAKVQVGSLQATFQISIWQPAQPAGIQITGGNSQTAAPGSQLLVPLTARVVDIAGNPVPNVAVLWQALGAPPPSLSGVVSTSDANGYVSAIVTLQTSTGPAQVQLRLAIGTAPPVIFTAQSSGMPTGLAILTGSNQSAMAGAAFPENITVQLFALQGPAAGFPVQLTSTGVSVVFQGGATVVTDAAGRAVFAVTAGTTPGTAIVTATAGNFTASVHLVVQSAQAALAPLTAQNAASSMPGPISPAEIVKIYGPGIAQGLRGCVPPNGTLGPLPYSLSTLQIQFSTEGYSSLAPLFSLCNFGPGNEFAVLETPTDLPSGMITIGAQMAGSLAARGTFTTVAASPGIFENAMSDGKPRAILQRQDGSYISLESPAQPGEQVMLIATGLGRPMTASGVAIGTDQAGIDGDDASAPVPVTVQVNGETVPVISTVFSSGTIGIYYVTFTIPSDAPAGTDVSLILSAGPDGAAISANPTSVPIQGTSAIH